MQLQKQEYQEKKNETWESLGTNLVMIQAIKIRFTMLANVWLALIFNALSCIWFYNNQDQILKK